MGIWYYAVDTGEKKYFNAPGYFSMKSPGCYHPTNPFPGMVVMMNCRGYNYEIWDDSGNNIPPEDGYENITDQVYDEYLDWFKEEP